MNTCVEFVPMDDGTKLAVHEETAEKNGLYKISFNRDTKPSVRIKTKNMDTNKKCFLIL